MSPEEPIVIVGAGLSGLSCAWHLNKPHLLIEKEEQAGGTARSYSQGGFTFDHTGHLLHLHNPYTRELIARLLAGNINECRRNAWIYSHGVFTRYPFQANLYGLPPRVVRECLEGLKEAQGRPVPGRNISFEHWCRTLFGEGIARYFLLPYNRKLWRTDPKRMTPDWCGPFVPRPAYEEVRKGALWDNPKAYGYNTSFFYPRRGGIQALPNALVRGVEGLRLRRTVERVNWREKTVLLSSGRTQAYRHLVATLPLTELLGRLDPFPPELRRAAALLRWTSVLCLNIGVQRPDITDKSWIYFPESRVPFYRIGFPATFSPQVAPKGSSSMYVEVSHRPGLFCRTAAERRALLKDVREGLIKCGILNASDELPVVSFLPIPHAYVVYDGARREALSGIFAWLEKREITPLGRYGAWKYSFMEEAILDGRAVAQALGDGRSPRVEP